MNIDEPEMIPRADADLAVALMVEKAADIVGMCDQVGADAEGPVRALAPASALSELQELRDSDAESKGNLAHALHQLGQAKAELAQARAEAQAAVARGMERAAEILAVRADVLLVDAGADAELVRVLDASVAAIRTAATSLRTGEAG